MSSPSQATVNPSEFSEPPSALSTGVDRLGAFASGACAVHCMLCAFLPGVLATVGVSWVKGHAFEWGFTLVAVLFGLVAALAGWRTHRSVPAVSLIGGGVAGLLAARFLEESVGHSVGAAVGLASGGVLIAGHLLSLRASNLCVSRQCKDNCA